MQIFLDIVGSIITGGMVLLIHLGLLSRMSAASSDLIFSNVNTDNTLELTKILETDFYKIGYKDTTFNSFELAEQNQIKFRAPYPHPDSSARTIHYYMGTTSQMTSTQNPYDKPLFRKRANENAIYVGAVRDFNLTYLDSAGNSISYSDLVTQEQRRRIKGVTIQLRVESSDYNRDKIENNSENRYSFVEWSKTVYPRNTINY